MLPEAAHVEVLAPHMDAAGVACRGLARALLSSSLVAAREEGYTSASLGVDTDSPTGDSSSSPMVNSRMMPTSTNAIGQIQAAMRLPRSSSRSSSQRAQRKQRALHQPRRQRRQADGGHVAGALNRKLVQPFGT